MNRIASLVLFMLAVASVPAWGQQEFPFTGRVVASEVNIRAGQSKNFEELTELQQGEEIIVVGKSFSWYKILLPDHAQNYVFAKFVEPLGDDIGMVTATNLNIRARPDVQSSVIGRLAKGTFVRLRAEADDWYQIEPVDQSFGWVHEDLIAFHARQVPPPRVVTPPVRETRSTRRARAKKSAPKPVAKKKKAVPQVEPPPAAEPPKFVAATGVIAGLKDKPLTPEIRHQLVVDGKPAYYLKGYRKIMDGFLNYKVNIEGEVLSDFEASHPVVLVTKIRLIL